MYTGFKWAAALVMGFGFLGVAHGASIDCKKARAVDEKTICATYHLGQLDARMATLFEVSTSLVAMGETGDIRDSQTEWLTRRGACGENVKCLSDIYTSRIEQLQKVIDRVVSGGPY